ncbi:MAG: zf-HC2 domain-containing protein [Moraxellaceae bacterium]|jgi:anti-sigma factor ChrR (cupin superfamily)|nr:zf-HC2 domain-containing protein [Moraxellaceae bacterium]MBK8327545.1 zf-HC2 domain-containing protein [Moraxellaceae bacterium]HQV80289.1 zf-HC2 domain-containing protein [Agitococcus sp.]
MLKCRDVLVQADAYLADELTSWQRVSFRVHLGLCRHCRRYLKNLRLTQAVSTQIPTTDEPSVEQLDEILLLIQQQKDE